jgi:hypothetical protein
MRRNHRTPSRGASKRALSAGGVLALTLASVLIGASCATPPSGGPAEDPNTTVIDCELDVECSGSVDAVGSSITVLAEAGSETQLTIGVNNSAPLDCPDYTELNPNQYLIDVPAQDRPKEVTIRIDKAVIDAVPNFNLLKVQQCYGAPVQFDSLSFDWPFLVPAPLNPVTNEYEGLLPPCLWGLLDAPCVKSVTRLDDGDPLDPNTFAEQHDGDVEITSLLPGGDPRMK